MSVFQFQAQQPVPINVIVSSNSATDIVDATNNMVWVAWLQVNEVHGGTQNLTVAITDGTNTIYLGDDAGTTWVATAVTAKKSYQFTQGYPVPKGWKLQVTSSDAAGYFHVIGVKQNIV